MNNSEEHSEFDYYGTPDLAASKIDYKKNIKFFLIGYYRKIFKKRHATAISDWCEYYKGMHRDKHPDVDLYKKLLHAHGVWNLPVPFCQGSKEYFSYHQDGIFMADIEVILESWVDGLNININIKNKKTPEELSVFEKIEIIDLNWAILSEYDSSLSSMASVSSHEMANILKRKKFKSVSSEKATKCVEILFLSDKNNWIWLKDAIHKDNLALLIRQVVKQSSQENAEKIVKKLIKENWLSENLANSLIKDFFKSEVNQLNKKEI